MITLVKFANAKVTIKPVGQMHVTPALIVAAGVADGETDHTHAFRLRDAQTVQPADLVLTVREKPQGDSLIGQ